MHGFTCTRHQIQFRYELLPHPAYSSDLAPCEFSKPEERFGGKRFITKEQFIAEIYFEGLDKSYYSDGKKLENCWIKCIELKGDYVEK